MNNYHRSCCAPVECCTKQVVCFSVRMFLVVGMCLHGSGREALFEIMLVALSFHHLISWSTLWQGPFAAEMLKQTSHQKVIRPESSHAPRNFFNYLHRLARIPSKPFFTLTTQLHFSSPEPTTKLGLIRLSKQLHQLFIMRSLYQSLSGVLSDVINSFPVF